METSNRPTYLPQKLVSLKFENNLSYSCSRKHRGLLLGFVFFAIYLISMLILENNTKVTSNTSI